MTNLLIEIDRGPNAGPNECGECVYLECNGMRYCEAFSDDLSGNFLHLLRCPACIAAEAAAKRVIGPELERIIGLCVKARDELGASYPAKYIADALAADGTDLTALQGGNEAPPGG